MAPANVPLVLAVGAYTEAAEGAGTSKWAGSNDGKCVDLWAPGTDINAAVVDADSDLKSGTSMAAPQVTLTAMTFDRMCAPVDVQARCGQVAGAMAVLRGLFPQWRARRAANELIGASVPRTGLGGARALDAGQQQWTMRFFSQFVVKHVLDVDICMLPQGVLIAHTPLMAAL